MADLVSDPAAGVAAIEAAAAGLESAACFARRVDELGYRVRPRPDRDEEAVRRQVAESDRTDGGKFAALGYDATPDPGAPDLYDRWFADHTVDPVTGALPGRFIAEERDSERLQHGAWVAAAAPPPATDA